MEKIDKSNMRKIILNFSEQFRIGLEGAKNVKSRGKFDAVLVCGMGGSALPGDIVRMWLKDSLISLPLFICRNYGLPEIVDEKYLVVCISYSGNTEETIYNYQEAVKKHLKTVVITTGGQLAKLCKKNKTPVAIIPRGIPPRLAIGCQFAALMKILSNCGIIKDESENILALEKALNPKKTEEQGRKIAKKIYKKIPVIYTAQKWLPLAYIWKISLNETAKIITKYNSIPEACHNEIVGFWKINEMQLPSKKFYTIFLEDKSVFSKVLKQMKITKNLIEKEGIKTEVIAIKGKNTLNKIFSILIL